MEGEGDNVYQPQEGTRIKDLEERQRLLKDRIVLIGNTLVDIRERTVKDMQELKKAVVVLQEEMKILKSTVQKIGEHTEHSARQEDVNIIQRQLDMLRGA